jgi:hypothetical protein
MENFTVFLAATFAGHTVAVALLVGLVALILDIPLRSLVVPFFVLAYCGFAFSTLLFWAGLARDRAKAWAFRSGLAMFAYSQVLMLALGFSAVRLHVMSLEETVDDFLKFAVWVSLVAFAAGYLAVRQISRPPHSA